MIVQISILSSISGRLRERAARAIHCNNRQLLTIVVPAHCHCGSNSNLKYKMTAAAAAPSELIQKYQTILNHNGLGYKQIVDVIVSKPKLLGEHFGSVCTYVTLKLANGEPDYELFVKSFLPKFFEKLGSKDDPEPFNKEPDYFNIVLKDLQEFYVKNSNTGKPLDFFPKCLYADKQEIIMENLVKMYGYYVNPKDQRQDMEHIIMVIENLAHYHATSYALMKDLRDHRVDETTMKKYEYYMREILYMPESHPMMMVENAKTTALAVMKNNNVPGADKALQALEEHGANIIHRLINLASKDGKNVCLVMNHGDFWNNNMLFLKDPVTGQLKHNVFVDFQVGRIASPNLDLVYFLNMSARKEVRQQTLQTLLPTYYKKFCSTVEELSKTPFLHTFEEFVADFKAKSLMGFWMNVLMSLVIDAIANINTAEVDDLTAAFHDATTKWIETNPDKAKLIAEEIVDICVEYEQLLAE